MADVIGDALIEMLNAIEPGWRSTGSVARYQQFASTPVTSQEQVEAVIGATRSHEWKVLQSFQGWRGSEDNLVAYAVDLGRVGRMLLVRDPVELYDSKSLFLYEHLTGAELEAIRELATLAEWIEV